jgi:hypothetical protein
MSLVLNGIDQKLRPETIIISLTLTATAKPSKKA